MAAKEQIAFQLDPRIRIWPDPLLRSKALPVEKFDDALTQNANRMALFMKAAEGQGVAAQQCGLLSSLLLFNHEDKVVPAVNPILKEHTEEMELGIEGCLSLPGLQFPVPRFLGVRVEAQDLEGESFLLELEGHAARVLQHEMDHLRGTLIMDYLSTEEKTLLLRELFQQIQA